MKALIFILISLVLLTSCNETKTTEDIKQIPQKTLEEDFKAANPDAKDVTWEMEGEFKEVEYTENGITKSIVYNTEGKVVESETEMNPEQLPSAIITYITQNYSDAEIEEAEKLKNSEGFFFEVEIENEDDEEIELLFDKDGNFINEEIETDDEDEENEVEINPSELPTAVRDYIDQNYADYSITEAEEETTEEGKFYEVELTRADGEEIDLVFDLDGSFIKIEED